MKMIGRIASALCISILSLLGFQAQLSAQDASHELTYNGQIGKIINENCVVCHQEGGIGPMQFQNYDQVRPWAPLISFKVANKEMPPYAYDDGIGIQHLIGDWRLKQDEIDLFLSINSDEDLKQMAKDSKKQSKNHLKIHLKWLKL